MGCAKSPSAIIILITDLEREEGRKEEMLQFWKINLNKMKWSEEKNFSWS